MNTSFANKSLAIFILLMNIYFISFTFIIIINDGGTMGFGYLLLPYLFFAHLFIIPSALVLFNNFKNEKSLLFLNIIGSSIIFLYIFAILIK